MQRTPNLQGEGGLAVATVCCCPRAARVSAARRSSLAAMSKCRSHADHGPPAAAGTKTEGHESESKRGGAVVLPVDKPERGTE